VEYSKDIEELFADCAIKAKMVGYIKPGDHMVISAGVPVDIPGNTNIIRVLEVK
jgi:pyruvate kinase